ncbi:hypothetical protein Hanom_Chr02g00146731 [Helianthus anomalus]
MLGALFLFTITHGLTIYRATNSYFSFFSYLINDRLSTAISNFLVTCIPL